MDVTPLIRRDTKVIQSYKGGQFRVSNAVFNEPIIVMADAVLSWPQSGDLTVETFAPLVPFAEEVEIVLLGTGRTMRLLSSEMRRAIRARYGFSIDCMDTGAACRTYNVLMAEGRKVAAALLPFALT